MQPPSDNAPTRVLRGKRAARKGKIRLGCSAVLFDEGRTRVLLTRRRDNGQWCLPGGTIDPGETVAEACAREVREETGLEVRVKRLVGVYSDPDLLVIYPDGNKVHIIVLCFEVERLAGEPALSAETLEVDLVPLQDALRMDLFHGHGQHLNDALAGQEAAFVR